MKKIICMGIAAGLLLAGIAGCGKQTASSISGSGAEVQSVPQSQPEASSVAAEKPATLLPQLVPSALEGLDTTPTSWWFGKERDEQNRPTECVRMQQELGSLGLTALGPEENAVYLTFDFGYETGYSQSILDTLQQKQASATFFIVKGYAEQNPDTLRRMVEEGHSVGSHSITHPGAPSGIPGLSVQQQREEISALDQLLQQEYQYQCYLFRYPEGIYSQQSLAIAAELGYYSVFWGFAYNDWSRDEQPNPGESLQKALDSAHPGAIYLLHPQSTNAAILGDLIDGLRAKGYEVKGL